MLSISEKEGAVGVEGFFGGDLVEDFVDQGGEAGEGSVVLFAGAVAGEGVVGGVLDEAVLDGQEVDVGGAGFEFGGVAVEEFAAKAGAPEGAGAFVPGIVPDGHLLQGELAEGG